MKKLNLFLGIVLVLLVGFVIYFFAGGALNAQMNVITAPAAEYPEAFASIQNVLTSGSAPQLFAADFPEDAANYTLADITVTLANRGLFPAEWLDVTVTGVGGDVAVYSLTGEGSSIPALSTGQVNLKLITSVSESVPREITIRYYVFGMQRTVRIAG